MSPQIVQIRNHGRALKYGLNKVRFPTPVPVDSRLLLHMAVKSAERADRGTMIVRAYTMELEGAAKPAAVAEMLTLAYPLA